MMITDLQFEDHILDEVEFSADRQLCVIRYDKCVSFAVRAPWPFEPAPGMTARFYGRGFGYTVRGLAINGVEFFYRTEAEDDERHKKAAEEADAKKKREAEEELPRNLQRIAALPEFFRRRLERFNWNNPDFWWESLAYELFTCEQAVIIAVACPTGDDVKAFAAMAYAEQRQRVPDLDDGHSGNTFGMACRLAFWYVTEPQNVVKEHGALCALVGCKAYGCAEPEEVKLEIVELLDVEEAT